VFVLVAVAVFWKEFKLLSFDYEFMAVQGWPVRVLDLLLTSLIVIAIAIGLQVVGVVLMSALLVAPAAAARQWSNRLPVVLLIAALIGGIGGVGGALLSSSLGWSTGPAVVLVVSAFALLSLFFAPQRGILWSWIRHRYQHRQVRVSAVLAGIYRLAVEDPDPFRAHSVKALDAVGIHAAQRTMPELERQGWVKRAGQLWQLTEPGLARARQLQGDGGGR
jgi:manganese/zinc/iron transport system permease protein